MTIICTYGPSLFRSNDLEALFEVGVKHLRIPSSKLSPKTQIEQIRGSILKAGDIDIIVDFPGSKYRLSNTTEQSVERERLYKLYYSDTLYKESSNAFYIYPGITSEQVNSDIIIVGDGKLAFEVMQKNTTHLLIKPLKTMTIGPRRGICFQQGHGNFKTLTKEDIQHFDILDDPLVNSIMLSFVESKNDIIDAKEIISTFTRQDLTIYSKIETLDGINKFDEIAALSDYVVLGRGDLLLNTGVFDFAKVQDAFLEKAQQYKEKVIIGTEILQSLSHSYLPSRAELTSLFYFQKKGYHSMLLSCETTVGIEPLRVVNTLNTLINNFANP